MDSNDDIVTPYRDDECANKLSPRYIPTCEIPLRERVWKNIRSPNVRSDRRETVFPIVACETDVRGSSKLKADENSILVNAEQSIPVRELPPK